MPAVPTPAEVRRSRRWVAAVVAILVVTGVVLSALYDGDLAILGGFLLGVAVIVASSRIFYEIGIGEDRERASRGGGASGEGE